MVILFALPNVTVLPFLLLVILLWGRLEGERKGKKDKKFLQANKHTLVNT